MSAAYDNAAQTIAGAGCQAWQEPNPVVGAAVTPFSRSSAQTPSEHLRPQACVRGASKVTTLPPPMLALIATPAARPQVHRPMALWVGISSPKLIPRSRAVSSVSQPSGTCFCLRVASSRGT